LIRKKKQAKTAAREKQAKTEPVKTEAASKLTELEEALGKALAEKDELKDKLLRAYAELENVRNRSRRDVQEAGKYAIDKFASAIIEVVDNLERAVAIEKGNEEELRTGVKMTLDSWHETLHKFGLERLDAEGAQFDPHLHEAMLHVPSDRDEGQVIEQYVAGYTLHGRLLRPAKVVVSSGPPEQKADARKENSGA